MLYMVSYVGFPSSVIAKEKSLTVWVKIMKKTRSHLKSMYIDIFYNINGNCWAKRISFII